MINIKEMSTVARRGVAAGSRVAPLDDLQMSEAAISPDKVTVSHAPSRSASAYMVGYITRQFCGMTQKARPQIQR